MPNHVDFKVTEQNMTEGAPSHEYWLTDVLLLSETNQSLIRKHSPSHFNWYIPRRDAHQAIGWNTRTFKMDDPPGKRDATMSTMFHGSGQGDDRIAKYIRTPSRWLHEVDLELRLTGEKFTFGEMWWLNSWRKEQPRAKVIMLYTRPVVSRRMAAARRRGRFGIFAGDTNNTVANFTNWFAGYATAPKRGLDRFFWVKDKRLRMLGIREGAKVGVGNDLKHNSLIASFRVVAPADGRR